jgi:hypothetical protein
MRTYVTTWQYPGSDGRTIWKVRGFSDGTLTLTGGRQTYTLTPSHPTWIKVATAYMAAAPNGPMAPVFTGLAPSLASVAVPDASPPPTYIPPTYTPSAPPPVYTAPVYAPVAPPVNTAPVYVPSYAPALTTRDTPSRETPFSLLRYAVPVGVVLVVLLVLKGAK